MSIISIWNTDAQLAAKGYGRETAGGVAVISPLAGQQTQQATQSYGSQYTPVAQQTSPQAVQQVNNTSALNTQYQGQLQDYMKQDQTGGYGAQLQQMASGKFDSSDPSYQWRFAQGQQAVERSAAARGLLGSGNAAVELQQYGQGAASQEYGAQFSRLLQASGLASQQYQQGYSRLAELAGMTSGQQIASGQLSLGYAGLSEKARESDQATQLGYAQVAQQGATSSNQTQLGYAGIAASRATSAASLAQQNAQFWAGQDRLTAQDQGIGSALQTMYNSPFTQPASSNVPNTGLSNFYQGE